MVQRIIFREREWIEFYLDVGLSHRSIAKFLNRDHTVVSREITRNSSPYLPYKAIIAQKATDRKSKRTNKRKLDTDKQLNKYIVSSLKKDWSPEQISGRLREHPPPRLKDKKICPETIYQYIYNDGRDGCFNRLYTYLRQAQSHRQPRYSRKYKKVVTIPDRVSIHNRPEAINKRLEYGHWESDTMSCKYRKPVSVQYERKALLVRIHKLGSFGANDTTDSIEDSISSLPQYIWKSITFDNGGEAAHHTKLRDGYNTSTYFCDPYKSWQKGGVENMNGLIRQYLPKGINLNDINDSRVYEIQEKLNNRPRKSLNYSTPNEIVKQIT